MGRQLRREGIRLHYQNHDFEFAEVLKAASELPKVSWAMIEQDQSKLDPLDSIRISREYLKKTFSY